MASKQFEIQTIGTVSVFKRRGCKRITMRVSGTSIKVIQPYWMPYTIGRQFAVKNASWINSQQANSYSKKIKSGINIGKTHKLIFITDSNKLSTRIVGTNASVYLPNNVLYTDSKAQQSAKKVIKRALVKEAKLMLPSRLNNIANSTNTKYANLSFKSMRSRWGSCTSKKDITLNVFLLMCPWDLIDYVMLHELAHTVHLNHSKKFWDFIELHMPDYKKRKKQLKEIQSSILYLQS